MRIFGLLAAVGLVACGGGETEPAPPAGEAVATAEPAGEAESAGKEAAPKRWFIAAANPYAVEAGAEILRRGGSAVDAAVATQAMLGLVEPQSSGLGGGAFMIHYDPATGALEAFNGRETAPASATPDRFLTGAGDPMNFYDAVAGGLSVGVPGAVRMLELAHDKYGEMKWASLFQSTIDRSEAGFNVSPRLNELLGRIPRLKQLPAAAAYFYDETGVPHAVGYALKNPAYAQTLRTIADGGADAFYEGAIAEAIVDAVNTAPNPGGMTLDDIRSYRAEILEPVCSGYRAYQICSMGPPSSGGVTTLQILTMLEPFDMAGAGANSIEALHLLLESSRLAYADREQYLADNQRLAEEGGLSPELVIAGLLNPDYLAARSALISKDRAAENVEAGDPSEYANDADAGKWQGLGADASPEPPSTSHFTIVDGEGRVVSMTTTVEFAFGSHLMAGGMVLNNQLTDFSFLPERDGKPVANAVGPGKRPRSSMSPAIVFDDDGAFYSALGSPGGPAIIGYVVKTLIAMLDWNMSLQDAVDAPHAVYPRGGAILEEDRFDAQIVAGLEAKGHEVATRGLTSGVHAVRVLEDGSFEGAADKRREGAWDTGLVEAE
ncbi:MAG: gamma-glutamyltransferase [Pseudomonadota bacterium]